MRRSIRTLLILAILIVLGVGVATVVKRRGNESSTTASPTVTTALPPFASTTPPGAVTTTTSTTSTTTSSTSTSTTTSTTIAPLTEHPNTGGSVPPLALGLAVLVAGAGGIVVLRCASPSGPTSGRR